MLYSRGDHAKFAIRPGVLGILRSKGSRFAELSSDRGKNTRSLTANGNALLALEKRALYKY